MHQIQICKQNYLLNLKLEFFLKNATFVHNVFIFVDITCKNQQKN